MQKSVWKAMFLLIAFAVLSREVSASPPIITGVSRGVFAQVFFDHPINDSQSNSSPGPADLNAVVSATQVVGDAGSDILHAKSSQQSTVDTFGFSLTASLNLDGFAHGFMWSDATARTSLEVTYHLDEPFAYQFTLTKVGTPELAIESLNNFQFPPSGVLQPGSYTFRVFASQTMNIFIGQRFVVFTETATLRLTPLAPPFCVVNTSIPNVALPQTTLNLPFPMKPWQVQYGSFAVDFQVTATTGTGGCVAQSNTGSFSVSGRPFVTGSEPFDLFAQSSAAATVKTLQPAEVVPLQGDYLINGPFVASAHYMQWQTAGFTTELTGSPPQSLFTGPVTAWLNLDVANLSPDSHTFEEIVRGAEPIIHQGLMNAVPLVATYTVFQDPGRVTLLVLNAQGQATGVQANGSLIQTIPLSFYYPSATVPAAILLNLTTGSFRVIVTGVEPGSFALGLATEDMTLSNVRGVAAQGTISAGSSLAFDATITPTQLTLQPNPIASLSLEINFLAAAGLDPGIQNSLSVKLQNARDHLSTGGGKNVVNELNAFIHEVEAQTGQKIPPALAAQLIGWTTDIITELSAN